MAWESSGSLPLDYVPGFPRVVPSLMNGMFSLSSLTLAADALVHVSELEDSLSGYPGTLYKHDADYRIRTRRYYASVYGTELGIFLGESQRVREGGREFVLLQSLNVAAWLWLYAHRRCTDQWCTPASIWWEAMVRSEITLLSARLFTDSLCYTKLKPVIVIALTLLSYLISTSNVFGRVPGSHAFIIITYFALND